MAGGSTRRSAGSPETAAPTSASSSGCRCPAAGRWSAGTPRPPGKAPSGPPAGPVPAPGGDRWVSPGNGAAKTPAEPYDGSDSVVKLTPNLVREDFFAPATWADDNANDRDLGSTQPVLAAGN